MALGLRLFNYRYIRAPLECQWIIKSGDKIFMWKIFEHGQEWWEDKIFIWTCVWLGTMCDFELMCGWDQIGILYWIWLTDTLGAFFNNHFFLIIKPWMVYSLSQLNIIYYLIHKIILYIILNYKNIKYKNLIDNIVIDFYFLKISQVWRI